MAQGEPAQVDPSGNQFWLPSILLCAIPCRSLWLLLDPGQQQEGLRDGEKHGNFPRECQGKGLAPQYIQKNKMKEINKGGTARPTNKNMCLHLLTFAARV